MIEFAIPYWGDPRLLEATVDSVRAQDDPRWRLTVVDDAYPDATAGEMVRSLSDPRISYVRNERNLGIIGNFRRCVELATEPLVVVLGSDDILLPSYVSVVLAAHERCPQATIIQPGVEVVDSAGRPSRTLVDSVKQRLLMPRTDRPLLLWGDRLAASLLRGNWLYWPSLAFDRVALARAGFQDGFPIILDLAAEIDILAAGGSLLLVPDVCFRYRRHEQSASSATALDGSRFTDERRYFAQAAQQMAALGWTRAARAARWHVTSRLHALTLVPGALRNADRQTARQLWSHAVSSSSD